MSLLARRHRCAGHGQCALGPRAKSVRIACARRWGVGGDRAAAGSRQTVGYRACGGISRVSTRTWRRTTGSCPAPPPPPPFRIPRRDLFWGSH
ncbi:Excitatory Amino Acid Transporter 4 [Manis pentadactyla]|nr:Excitatory Amino Acid Transporter 4 [Manis pentadactyla]